MDYSFIIIGFIGGAILVLIISKLIFRKEKTSKVLMPDKVNALLSDYEIRAGVKMFLDSGRKIEAIKFIKEQKNLGLAESKKVVELMEKLGTVDDSVFKSITAQDNNTPANPELLNQVRKLVADGKKIEAIKLVVENRKMGLKEAKDLVDKLNSGYKS